MTKKVFISMFLMFGFISVFAQYGADDTYLDKIENTFDYLPIHSPETGYIADLVLIYQGGTARLPYTKSQIAPYVFKKNAEGEADWLFDGFLFLEFRTFDGYAFIQEFFTREPYRARKKEWTAHLDKVFERNKAVSALNQVLDSLANAGFTPERKRKVVISLPEPMNGQKDWGSLDGRNLDFSVESDRLIALKWYIDEIITRFNNGGFAHLELAGFYWVKESDDLSERLVQPVSDYVNEKGYILNWIPNWGPHRGENWEKRGFNAAYIQPNTFFSTGDSKNLPRVCTYASMHRMGVEVEFDHNIVDESTHQKLYDYFDNFETYKVLEKSAIAYYEGGRHFLTVAQSTDPKLQAIHKRLTDIIIERQKRVDQMTKK